MKIPVFLLKIDEYNEILEHALDDVLNYFDIKCKNILIKPNFIAAKNFRISCTNPFIIYYLSKIFLKQGCNVFIGDSPAFGSAKDIAKITGLYGIAKDLPVKIIDFNKKRYKGFYFSLAREIQDVDLIVNVCKLKAHAQMGLTLCVKNYFGLVVGLNKLLAHIKFGQNHTIFSDSILKILNFIPRSINIVDGILAMEKTGPLDGEEKKLNLIGVSTSAVAMDTAIYNLIGADINSIPLYKSSVLNNLYGSKLEHINLIKDPAFNSKMAFKYPKELKDISFRPDRVFWSFIKRCYLRLFK